MLMKEKWVTYIQLLKLSPLVIPKTKLCAYNWAPYNQESLLYLVHKGAMPSLYTLHFEDRPQVRLVL